jgi:S1-C subfamily serine protease
MARTPLYSQSPQRPAPAAAPASASASASATVPAMLPPPGTSATPTANKHGADAIGADAGRRWASRLQRWERWAWAAGALLLAVAAGWPAWTARLGGVGGAASALTLKQIDAALRESIAKQPLASATAAAYDAILPSVVRVVAEHAALPDTRVGKGQHGARPAAGKARSDHARDDEGRSIGTGVVIVDKGLILTNLHVVEGAQRITVTFADGSESEAVVVNHQRDQDLAVLQAKTIPDDLHAATLRSSAGLSPGDEVLAVGFPFGIGPSASAGVVSGLQREFRSPEGKRSLSNLIQFDAAANPGNSGGPLVTLDGHVVGIVTAIMNPNAQRTFIGIGFAVPIEAAAAAVGMHPF